MIGQLIHKFNRLKFLKKLAPIYTHKNKPFETILTNLRYLIIWATLHDWKGKQFNKWALRLVAIVSLMNQTHTCIKPGALKTFKHYLQIHQFFYTLQIKTLSLTSNYLNFSDEISR